MTQDEIIHMAKEIAWEYGKAERFQTWTHDSMMDRLMELVSVSAVAEREACAKEAEHWQKIGQNPEHKCGEYIASAIRGRGQA
jgi:hypothetical protein